MIDEPLLKLISLGALGLLAACAIFMLLELFKVKNPARNLIVAYRHQTIFFFSLFATASSLFLSLYFQLAACELCWYQRIFLFPIPLISFIAVLKNDANARLYTLWLSIVGFAIAIYHSLLQGGIIKGAPVFCNPASPIDCANPYFVYYGFVTIPVISAITFLTLIILSYVREK